jgi:hypothetical protein
MSRTYPCKPTRRYFASATLATFRRQYWGSVRQATKQDLAAGREPDPTRHRHSLLWELS